MKTTPCSVTHIVEKCNIDMITQRCVCIFGRQKRHHTNSDSNANVWGSENDIFEYCLVALLLAWFVTSFFSPMYSVKKYLSPS